MASTYLEKTFSGNGTNANKWTFSAWLKRTSVTTARILTAGTSTRDGLVFNSSNKLQFFVGSNSTEVNAFETNRLFRDTNAWYHIVVSADSTQSGASNQTKLYVNGVRDTDLSQSAVDSNLTWHLGNGVRHRLGADSASLNTYFDGVMSHVHFCDGYVYDADDFGETDANGVWKIKTSPSVTYGTNGFFILKDGNSVTDQSGNGNNFTVAGGTLTNTEDNPSNVFATLNPLIPSNGTFSEGNNTVTTSSSSWCTVGSNLGTTSGKYYWEVKMNLLSGSTTSFYTMIGFARLQGNSSDLGSNLTSNLGDNNGVGIYSDNGSIYHPGGTVSYTSSFKTSGNIIGVALDLDNNYAYWSINGTWQNSGDPTSGATGTGGYDLSSFADGSFIVPASSVQNYASANQSENEYNFGNGYFGTTAVSSAGTNASGNGIFEYDVPTGYTALSTKGLNT